MALKVWIVDDDLVSQFSTEYCIRQANKDALVKSFDNAISCLDKFKDCLNKGGDIPNIIILDIVMPQMDGWDFLTQVGKLVGWDDKVNVYVLSSFAKSKDREYAKKHPLVRGYFDKPLSNNSADKIFESVKV